MARKATTTKKPARRHYCFVIATIPAPTNMITDKSSVTMPAFHANSAMAAVRFRSFVITPSQRCVQTVNDVNTVRRTSKGVADDRPTLRKLGSACRGHGRSRNRGPFRRGASCRPRQQLDRGRPWLDNRRNLAPRSRGASSPKSRVRGHQKKRSMLL